MVGGAADLFARWSPGRTDQDRRAFTQRRIALFNAVTLAGFVALLSLMNVVYGVYPSTRPARATIINAYGVAGLVLLAWGWALARRPTVHGAATLAAVEIAAIAIISAALTTSGILSADQPANVYSAFIWMSFVVFTRVLVIPGSARWTAAVSSLGVLPMLLVAAVVDLGIPRPALVGGTVVFCLVVVGVSTVGAHVIYGLRVQVAEAMQLGQYTLLEKIGEGGMGAVYRARHALLRRPTAIKLLHPDRSGAHHLERFEREVQHTAELTHPNTVAIYDYGHTPDGVFYYAMEYLDGIDLQSLVDIDGPQSWRRVVHILRQVAGALGEAHDRGLVHRDVKPHNIILCRRGGIADIAKVVDFGLVKEIDAAVGLTKNDVVGTPAYLAPEAITTPDEVGPASDLYALGAVAYCLLTGAPPFRGLTVMEICLKHVRTPPDAPSQRVDGIPAELDRLVLDCLAKSPGARPADATALRARLDALAAAAPWSEAEAVTWWQEHGRRREAGARSPEQATAPSLPVEGSLTIDLARRTLVEIELGAAGVDQAATQPPPSTRSSA